MSFKIICEVFRVISLTFGSSPLLCLQWLCFHCPLHHLTALASKILASSLFVQFCWHSRQDCNMLIVTWHPTSICVSPLELLLRPRCCGRSQSWLSSSHRCLPVVSTYKGPSFSHSLDKDFGKKSSICSIEKCKHPQNTWKRLSTPTHPTIIIS